MSSTALDVLGFIASIQRNKRKYENYEQDLDSAPTSLRPLISTSRDLLELLSESEGLFTRYSRPYPAQTVLTKRLDETDNFLQRHHGPSPSLVGLGVGSWTAPGLYDATRAKRIQEAILMECQKLIQFLLVLSLRDNSISLAVPAPRELSGRLRPEGSKVEDIVRRLSEVKYQVGRRQSQFIQRGGGGRDLDLTDLESKVDQEWRLLCLRAGFEDRSRRPPLPASARNLLLSTTQVYQTMVIAYSRDTVIGPRSATLTVSPGDRLSILRGDARPKSSISQRPAAPRPGSLLTPESERGKLPAILGDPALPAHVAEFEMRPGRMLKLQHWKCEHVAGGSVILWTGSKSSSLLRHDFPSGIIPYTTHGSISSLEERHSVSFHEFSRIRWRRDGEQVLDEQRENTAYRFVEIHQFRRFQEDFRDMDLLDTFDIESIVSSRKGWGEASNQDLKVWRSRDIDQIHTLTFYANHIKDHLEFPMEWFRPDFEVADKKKEVLIRFRRKPGVAGADPKALPLFSRLSAGKRAQRLAAASVASSSSDQASMRSSSSISNPRASISTMSSSSSAQSATAPGPSRVQALADLAGSFEFIRIKFSDDHDAGDVNRGFVRFVKLFKSCLREQHPSSIWTRSSSID